jgi:hypothetical protein
MSASAPRPFDQLRCCRALHRLATTCLKTPLERRMLPVVLPAANSMQRVRLVAAAAVMALARVSLSASVLYAGQAVDGALFAQHFVAVDGPCRGRIHRAGAFYDPRPCQGGQGVVDCQIQTLQFAAKPWQMELGKRTRSA